MTFIIDGQKISRPSSRRVSFQCLYKFKIAPVPSSFQRRKSYTVIAKRITSDNSLNNGQYQLLTYKGKESGLTFTLDTLWMGS